MRNNQEVGLFLSDSDAEVAEHYTEFRVENLKERSKELER
jgi:hypothetical protein